MQSEPRPTRAGLRRLATGLRSVMPPERRRRMIRPAWLGTLRRTTPLSDDWGCDRGSPVDRYYIERFLGSHRADIQGRVLEVRDDRYTSRFGTRVMHSDVLDIDATNPNATIYADLAAAHAIPSDTFDCFVLTQTLQFVYDTRAAVAHSRRILRPGGVLLVTVPGIIRVDGHHVDNDYWRFTAASCGRLFGEAFGDAQVTVRSYGNVLAAVAFLMGMARQELSRRELDSYDPCYPVVVCVRAVKR